MIYLFLLKYIPRQVILTCDKQTKCIVGDYCSSHNLCYTCSYITNNHCDSLTGCCSQAFLHQCPDSPYPCENTNTDTNTDTINPSSNGLHTFLIVFCVGSLSYISVGSYWNKYVREKKGCDIVPNKQYWISLFSLVEDGIWFTLSKIRRCFPNHSKMNQYTNLE